MITKYILTGFYPVAPRKDYVPRQIIANCEGNAKDRSTGLLHIFPFGPFHSSEHNQAAGEMYHRELH